MDAAITLEPYEQAVARFVGTSRHQSALDRGLPDRYGAAGAPEKRLQIHVDGAAGEMAVAKHLNVYWDGSVDTFHSQPDVGPYHVRTRSKDWYELTVRQADADGPYVLVTGTMPSFLIKGYFDVKKEALDQGWWKNPGGYGHAWFIPQDALSQLGASGWEVLVA